MNGKLLSSGAVMSDDNLALQVSKVSSLSSKVSLSWLSTPVLVLSLLASVLSGIVYVSYDAAVGPPPLVGIDIHRVTGIVFGMLLLLRISLGTAAVATAASKVQSFNKACRTLAVLSSYVGETLTISAGAELEKKAVAKFRFELVRLLNLAVFSYHLMLKGLKMTIPPVSMRVEGSKMESEILASCSNPSIMVVKWITLLIEQQRQAQRIGNEQAAAMMGKVDELLDAYHGSLELALAPSSGTLESFSKFFVLIWVFTASPVLALKELSETGSAESSPQGLALALAYTFASALFFFGLYEAGTVMDKPLRAITQLLPLDDLKYALSSDLTDLVDDPEDSVPVFLTAEEE